jgi:TonB-linked SusC/RagA family outer membrane protein
MKNIKSKVLILLLSVLFSFQAYSQTIEITGQVTDDKTGDILVSATVSVLGTDNGTVTNFDGIYNIKVNDPDAKLLFQYLGYRDKIVTIDGEQVINVQLSPTQATLDEVVVVGYGVVKKSDLTGSVGNIKSKSFEKGAPLSVQDALAGRISGVQITQNDNAPGSGMRILIRGGTTLTAGNQPLFVIDGFLITPDDSNPNQNPLADINPNDIESIEVLKDASSTAAYGALGANGVVIVTTKSGKAGKPRISVNASSGVSVMDNVPNILSPDEYLEWQINRSAIQAFYEPNAQANIWQAIRDSGQEGSVWIDRITREAIVNQYDVSFSGGTEDLSYRLSSGILNQEGVINNSEFNRFNLSAKLEQKIGDKIKIGGTMTYSKKEAVGMVNTWDEAAILKTVFQLNPFMPDDFDIADFDIEDPTFTFNAENPLTFMEEVDISNTTQRFLANVFFEYKLARGLTFYTSYGFNSFSDDYHEFYPSSVRRGFNVGGFARVRNRNTNTSVFQARLNYNKNIKKHNFNFTAVTERRTRDVELEAFGAEGFEDESLGIYSINSATNAYFPVKEFLQEREDFSVLGRFRYNYDSKYLLSASLRADASSVFGDNNKWGYFPAVAVGWVASKEEFIRDLNTFDLLKFRVSYGQVGNSQIPTFQSLASIDPVRYIFGDDLVVGQVPGGVANPDLTWETSEEFNIGIDLGFFNNRLNITADAYYKETSDLLLEVQLPLTSGFDTAIENVGAISNRGIELAINTVNIDNDNFKWTSAFTISANRSKILSLGENNEMFFTRQFYSRLRDEIILRVGENVGTFYGYVEDGVLNSENEIANSPELVVLENVVGGVNLKDINGDGVVDNNDRVIIGNSQPDFIGGLNNEFTYKNFDLSFFLRWSYGNDVINGNIVFLDRVGVGNWNTLERFRDNEFTPLNTNGTIHGQVPDTYSNLMRSSYVEDGSFLKVDYITLGYTMPEKFIKSFNITLLRFFARVNNPFLFSNYSWFDPEVSTGFGTAARVGPGIDVGTYPRNITYTLGLSLNF